MPKEFSGPYHARTCRLADGRLLGFADYGRAEHHTVFYFHGLPGSRYECSLFEPIATALGVRVISIDRPGYGLSTVQPGRGLRDLPADIAELADALSIHNFSQIAVSGGCSYAVACLNAFPDRIEHTSLVSALGPVSGTPLAKTLNPVARLALYLGIHRPGVLRLLYGVPLARLALSNPGGLMRLAGWVMPACDARALARPEAVNGLSGSLREAFRQGLQGAEDDVRIAAVDWEIELQAIRPGVHLWHGDRDRVVPSAHSRYLQAHLPGSSLEIVGDEGHFSLPINHARRIVEQWFTASGSLG